MRLGVDAAIVDGSLVAGDVEVIDDAIARIGLPAAGTGLLAAPGFVDLQVNGFAGVDLLTADPDGVAAACEALLATGVTAWQPTLITADPIDTKRAAAAIAAAAGAPGARILGIHLEGPFLAPARMGTHPVAHRHEPDLALLEELLGSGPFTYVTLAPERPGALVLVDHLVGRGIVVAAGHTDATAAEANLAFDRGVRTVTHLYNAMRGFSPRDPGVIGAALLRPDVTVQCIVDAWHLAPETVRLTWRLAAGRFALVTDAIAAAGLEDATSRLGEVEITVVEGAARREDGTLAGSVLTMPQAIRNLVAHDVPLSDAITAATAVPARILGREDVGRLVPGAHADVVVLDGGGYVQRVIQGGAATKVVA